MIPTPADQLGPIDGGVKNLGALPSCWPVAGPKRLGQAGGMTPDPARYPGYRFPAEIISHAIWLYHVFSLHVFSLSLRDVELILAERGIGVTHESIRPWCLKFGGDFARKLRRRRPKPGDTWHLDEVLIPSAKSDRCQRGPRYTRYG
jgi:putative transposase